MTPDEELRQLLREAFALQHVLDLDMEADRRKQPRPISPKCRRTMLALVRENHLRQIAVAAAGAHVSVDDYLALLNEPRGRLPLKRATESD